VNNSLRTQALAEGALMAAITAILGLAGIYLPFIRMFTDLLWTIPIVIVTTRHGMTAGAVSLGVAGLLIFTLAEPLQAVFLILQFGALAIFYGYAFKKGFKPSFTLLVGTGVTVFSFLLVILLMMGIFGADVVDLAKQIRASIEPTIQLYEKLGLFSNSGQTGLTEEIARQVLESFVYTLTLLVPAIFALWALTTAVLNYVIAQVVLLRLKISIPVLPPFRQWRLPWWSAWGFIIGFAAYLAGDYFALPTASQVGLNIMLLYAPILFVLGLSVTSFFFGKKLSGIGARIIIVLITVLFLQYIIIALMSVGLLDLLLNYRHLSRSQD